MIQDKKSSRDVAQFGRALCSGRRGRVFKSRHPDHQTEPGRNSRSGLSFLFYRFSRAYGGYLLGLI